MDSTYREINEYSLKGEELFGEVINGLLHDEIGSTIRSSPILLRLGKQFLSRYASKRKRRQGIMRTRSFLRAMLMYLLYKDSHPNASIEEVFVVTNLERLDNCLDPDNGNIAPSVFVRYVNTLKCSADMLSYFYIIDGKKEESSSVEDFKNALNKYWSFKLRRAEDELVLRRHEKSRRPDNLPNVQSVSKLLKFVTCKIEHCVGEAENLITVRCALSAYIMTINARRGGEVQRLTLQDLREGMDDEWDQEQSVIRSE